MKKVCFAIIMLLICILPFNVSAETTCKYSGSYQQKNDGKNISKDVNVECTINDKDKISCESSIGGTEGINNWGGLLWPGTFDAKKHYVENGRKCLPLLVFSESGVLVELYLADNETHAKELANAQWDTGILKLDGMENSITDSIKSHTDMLYKVNTENDPWKIHGCLTESGSLDPNKANYKVCRERVVAFFDDLKAWKKEVEDAISAGNIIENDNVVLEFKNAEQYARSQFNVRIDDQLGEDEEVDPSWEIEEGNATCIDIFGEDTRIGQFIIKVFNFIKFAIPIVIIILSIVEFIKAVAASDESEIKKASGKLVKRSIIGLLILVLPAIIKFILSLAGIEFCGL